MIKRILCFISLLRWLHHDQMLKNNLVTTFTTPCSRVKNYFFLFFHYIHYAMIKRKTFFFISALRSICQGHRKKNLIFIAPLLWLRYVLFLFYWDVHYGNIFLHDLTSTYNAHYVNNESKNFPNDILLGESMNNLKTFFLRNFSWALHDLLPHRIG